MVAFIRWFQNIARTIVDHGHEERVCAQCDATTLPHCYLFVDPV